MAYVDLFNEVIVHVLTLTFTKAVNVTVEQTRNPRQSDEQRAGLPVLGFEDTVMITAEMPVTDREAVWVSRTCKYLHHLHHLLYSDESKQDLIDTIWFDFTHLFVGRVLTMEPRTSCVYVLSLKGALERVYVGASHQEMLAVQSGTGAPLLNASGAVAWVGREVRLSVQWSEWGRTEVLPHNQAVPGAPDSRIKMLHDWLDESYYEHQRVTDEVTVLEHP